jgi:hypothetical protein
VGVAIARVTAVLLRVVVSRCQLGGRPKKAADPKAPSDRRMMICEMFDTPGPDWTPFTAWTSSAYSDSTGESLCSVQVSTKTYSLNRSYSYRLTADAFRYSCSVLADQFLLASSTSDSCECIRRATLCKKSKEAGEELRS